MVFSSDARRDVDNLMLTKSITYKSRTGTEDMATGDQTFSVVSKTVYFQGTVLSASDKLVREGLLNEGDVQALFRYEYTEEVDESSINPTITPKEKDEFVFLSKNYRIDKITPVTGEDDGIICFTADCIDIGVDN